MADIHLDDERPDAPGADKEGTGSAAGLGRLDRRSFLRALSGSALTMVAGGLTVTLAACQGASTSNPLVGSVTVPNTPVSLPSIPSQTSNGSFNSFGSGIGGSGSSNSSRSSQSSSSNSSNSSGSSSSNSSGSSSSNSSGSSSSNSSSRSASSTSAGPGFRIGQSRPNEFTVSGWSTRV
jgi:hypothetical protein